MNSPVEGIKSEKRFLLNKYLDEWVSSNKTRFYGNQDAIMVLDLEGNILLVNPSYEELSGYSFEEALLMKFQTLFPIESLDKIFHYFHKTTLGQVQNFDCFMISKQGHTVDLNITNIPISVDDKIVGLYAVIKNITELKRARAEVRQIEEFHRVLTDNILDIIVNTNLLGTILYVSPAVKHLLGFEQDEIIGQQLSSLFYKEDVQKAFLEREKLLNNLKGYNRGSYRFIKKDGSLIWLEAICKPIVNSDTQRILEIVSVFRDISERVKAEEELWGREKAFRNLIENSPDTVLIAKNDKILFINETGVALLGASSSEEIIHTSIMKYIHSNYRNKAKRRIKKVFNGETTDFTEYKIKRFDGTLLDVEIKGIPTFFQSQSAQHLIVRDITERKKTLELILHSEKLSIAGQLAAGIAHEVRNPLTAIKGFLQLMQVPLDNSTYVEIIKSEINRIEIILSELLILAKPQDVKFNEENLNTLIQEVKTLIDTQAIMQNIQIEFANQIGNLTISCDKNKLKQVFINFFKNSIEAMPNGGTIIIEIKKHSKNNAKITIQDTGTGIPKHILKKIGQPFFTTKEGGTGLGVMISKQIIENHNGSLQFWSDKKGTIIEVILPLNNKQ
ncbi:PAS domain S-box protein [Bacillus sp. FJAT-49825]|uniref:histidine kinase n=2 Tax=Neobacillus rhizophilus TaxID=2833579 RepID=A0A942U8A3_9BACI|nr:PAS domain S-box protein [Neobacillus rhizophilus]